MLDVMGKGKISEYNELILTDGKQFSSKEINLCSVRCVSRTENSMSYVLKI
jgi:hypothetical protein